MTSMYCPVCGTELRSEESGLLCDSCQKRNCPDCGGDHRKAGVAQSCDGPPRNTPDDKAEMAEARRTVEDWARKSCAIVTKQHYGCVALLILSQRRAAAEAEREACAQVVERRARLAEGIRPYYLDTHQSDMAAEKTGEAALFRLVASDIRERAIHQRGKPWTLPEEADDTIGTLVHELASVRSALEQLDYSDGEAELRAGIANLIASLE